MAGDKESPKFVPQNVVDAFPSYREAVVWCWTNRRDVGEGEKIDQSLCANKIGLPTPQMSRCVKPHSNAPMNLPPDLLKDFQKYTGWNAVSQYLASRSGLTIME